MSDVLRFSGLVINTFGDLANHAWLTGPLLPLLRNHYQAVADEQAKVADSAGPVSQGFDAMTDAAITATEGLDAMEDAIQGVLSANRALYGSETDVAGAIADATKEINKNGRGISLNSEKGRENREVLSRLANTLASNYEAYVKVNGAGARSQQVLDRNRTAFIRAAEAAGYTRRRANELANALLGVPTKKTISISLRGDTTSSAKITALKRQLASIKDRTVYVRVATVEGRRIKVEDQLERGRNREFGGPVTKGHAYVVGEKRAEVFVPNQDGRIIPSIEQYRRQGGTAEFGPYAGPRGGTATVQRMALDVNLIGAQGRIKQLLQEIFRETNLGYGG
jgi:hypothetical protein